MSIQSNFPTAKPSLLLDFANTKQLDPRITFTRASTANYYDGKTATFAEQNLFTGSSGLTTNWTNNLTTQTLNSVTAPDGTTTAQTLTVNSGATANCGIYQNSGVTASGTTMSVYAKAGTANFVGLSTDSAGVAIWANFDISKGTVVSSAGCTASITYVGNGWYRCVLANSTLSTSNGYAVIAVKNSNPGAHPWTNGTPVAGTYLYLWGAQLEQRSTVSAYTATTSVPITNYIPTLQSAASGVARFDSNPTTGESLGLLIEESRTNSQTGSAFFEAPAWTKTACSVSANSIVSPAGTITGTVLKGDGTASIRRLTNTSSLTGSGNTFSVYVKSGSLTYVQLFTDGVSTDYANYDLTAGTVTANGSTSSAAITAVGNGWYRVSLTTGSSSSIYISINLITSGTAPRADNPATSGFVYIWGFQAETGSSATSYVATPLTFTSRASSATYLGPNGYITSATTNTARNQTNSVGTTNLLLESAASNLFNYTEDFQSWSLYGGLVAVNQVQSPDGLVFADKIYEDTSSGLPHSVYQVVTVSSGSTYTLSFYAKAAERNYVGATAYGQGWIIFDLSAGNITYNPDGWSNSITAVGGGWYRCTVSIVKNNTFGNFYIGVAQNGTTYSYTGDGKSGIYLWGAQVEAGSTATSYIPSVQTFSGRSSSGTYYNSSGVLSTATSGTARTTYNPALLGAGGKLLLEPAATNLMLQSETFDNGTWAKANATVTANATTAPDGNTTADKLISNNGAAGQAYQSYAKSPTPTTYTATVYAKAAEFSWLQIAFYDGSTDGCRGWFNLSSGVTGTTAGIGTPYTGVTLSIQAINNGWYRCSLTATTNSAGANVVFLYPTNGDGASTIGNGTNGIYLWGAQCETGSGATSYIATTTATVTRAADTSTSAAQSRSADVYSASTVTRAADAASMTGTNFSSWYRQDEGTWYFEALKTASSVTGAVIGLSANYSDIVVGATNVDFRYGTSSPDVVASISALNLRVAGSYLPSSIHYLSVNGDTVVAGSSVSAAPVLTSLNIGKNVDSAIYNWNGPIKKIAYYPLRVTNTQLQALTS